MTAFAPQPGQLSPEAARLRQYLRWATIPNFVAIAALFAIYHVTHARPALIQVEAIVEAEPSGAFELKGFRRPVMTHNVLRVTAG